MWLTIGAVAAALYVAMSAVGAHLLRQHLDESLARGLESGLRQHAFHAVGLLLVGVLERLKPSRRLNVVGWAFVAGLLLFSVALYLRAVTGVHWLAALNPVGGFAFIGGWLALICAMWKK
jgi:uncharacterized membrane protein YgdD (TMEM256/DUF423 family)